MVPSKTSRTPHPACGSELRPHPAQEVPLQGYVDCEGSIGVVETRETPHAANCPGFGRWEVASSLAMFKLFTSSTNSQRYKAELKLSLPESCFMSSIRPNLSFGVCELTETIAPLRVLRLLTTQPSSRPRVLAHVPERTLCMCAWWGY